jgi:hypothetical protein
MFGVPVEWRLAAMAGKPVSTRPIIQVTATLDLTGRPTRVTRAAGGSHSLPLPLRLQPRLQLGNWTTFGSNFQNTIKHFRIATPLATPEDFCCVVYAPGIGGKADNYTGQYLGKTDTKKTQLDIYRNSLKGYDMPDSPGADEILGRDGSFSWWARGQKKKTGWAKTTDAQIGFGRGPGPTSRSFSG